MLLQPADSFSSNWSRVLSGRFGISISNFNTRTASTVSIPQQDQSQIANRLSCLLVMCLHFMGHDINLCGTAVRRRAESFVGKVTCLPGCITMISVRDEMAGAIRKYAEPVTAHQVMRHQVQYLVSRLIASMTRLTKCYRALTEDLHMQCYPKARNSTHCSFLKQSARQSPPSPYNIISHNVGVGAQTHILTITSTGWVRTYDETSPGSTKQADFLISR